MEEDQLVMNDDRKLSKFFFSNNDLVVKVLIFSEYLEADFGTKKKKTLRSISSSLFKFREH